MKITTNKERTQKGFSNGYKIEDGRKTFYVLPFKQPYGHVIYLFNQEEFFKLFDENGTRRQNLAKQVDYVKDSPSNARWLHMKECGISELCAIQIYNEYLKRGAKFTKEITKNSLIF